MEKTIVETHFDEVAPRYDAFKKQSKFYYQNLKKIVASIIPQGSDVLEIGCGTGDVIAFLKPKRGYGMDISSNMVKIARKKYGGKSIVFSTRYPLSKFKYLFMTDVIEHLEDPEKTFKKISRLMTKDSIFVNTMANPIWEPILMIWEKLGWKMPEGEHKRIVFREIEQLLRKSGLYVSQRNFRLLVPINIPFFTDFVNKYIEPLLKPLCFIEYQVVKKS